MEQCFRHIERVRISQLLFDLSGIRHANTIPGDVIRLLWPCLQQNKCTFGYANRMQDSSSVLHNS